MWYILKCKSGKEQDIIQFCKKRFTSEAIQDAFILTCERMKKYGGEWHKEIRSLYPDYIFLESSDETALKKELEPYRGMLEALEDERRGTLLQVNREEEKVFKELFGHKHHLELSRGFMNEKGTWITEGPLKGNEQLIKKIDRHKRIAKLKVPGDCRTGFREIWAGLELRPANVGG